MANRTLGAATGRTDLLQDLIARVAPVSLARERVLPVLGVLEPLFGSRGLTRGTVVGVGGVSGATSVALALMAGATRSGSWAACVGLPQIGWESAEEHGVDLGRVVGVDPPPRQWPIVVSTLVSAVDVVLCGPEVSPTPAQVRNLRARVREGGAVLVALDGEVIRRPTRLTGPQRDARLADPATRRVVRGWEADLQLWVLRSRWEVTGGVLGARHLAVELNGRGRHDRPRTVELIVGATGRIETVGPTGGDAVRGGQLEQVG